MVKHLPTMRETWVQSLSREYLLEKEMALPGKSHRWKSLVDYSPWGRKESDTTERLHFHFQGCGEDSVSSITVNSIIKQCLSHNPPMAQQVKNPPAMQDQSLVGKIPWRRSPPLQYSCLESPMDKGVWWAIVHGSQRVRHD